MCQPIVRSTWYLGVLASLGLLATLACSSRTMTDRARSDNGGTPSSGVDAGGDEIAGAPGSQGSGGAMGGGGIAGVGNVGSGGAVGGGGTTSSDCSEYLDILDAFQSAAAKADRPCATDDECFYLTSPSCLNLCPSLVTSKSGIPKLQPTLDQLDQQCAQRPMNDCEHPTQRCPRTSNYPACVHGQCTNFLAKDWMTLTFREHPSPFDGGCPGQSCDEWKIGADGLLVATQNGMVSRRTLSAAELSRVVAIAESVEFRRQMLVGFDCDDHASADVILLRRSSASVDPIDPGGDIREQLVTACVLAGPHGNDALALWNIAHGTFAEDAGP